MKARNFGLFTLEQANLKGSDLRMRQKGSKKGLFVAQILSVIPFLSI